MADKYMVISADAQDDDSNLYTVEYSGDDPVEGALKYHELAGHVSNVIWVKVMAEELFI